MTVQLAAPRSCIEPRRAGRQRALAETTTHLASLQNTLPLKSRLILAGALAALAALAALGGGAIFAQAGVGGPVSRPGRAPDDLVRQAMARDTVRVIVGLDLPAVPEGVLDEAGRAAQRARILQAQSAVLADLAVFDLGEVKRFRFVPAMALEASLAALDVLARHPLVAYLEEDAVAEPSLAQSTAIVGASSVWAAGFTGSGATVAILDTGVESAHPFFGGRIVSEACYSTTSGTTSTALCVDGSTEPGSATPCTGISGCDHGTHVAGIAAGSGSSFSGVAPAAGIVAIQVFSRFNSGCSGSPPCLQSYTSDQISGLERVYELRNTFGIAAANMSLGGGLYSSQASCDSANVTRKAAIDNLRSVGIATVTSSGNSGSTNSLSAPACISSAVSVGSTKDGSNGATPVDSVSSFSNSASFLSVLAPGEWITSSVLSGGFGTKRGTSMAAPHVTGAWALLKGLVPAATVDVVLNALTTTGVAILDPRNGLTKPRIDLPPAIDTFAATFPDGGGVKTPGFTGDPDVPSATGFPEAITTLHASAFEPRDASTTFASDPASGRWVTGGPSYLYAPLPAIPNGAAITQVLFYIDDSDASADFNARLCRHWVDSSTGANPGSDCPVNITSSGTGSRFIFAGFSPTLNRQFDVDNDGVVEDVSYTLSGGWGTSTSGSIKLRHVRVLWKRQVSPAPPFATFSDVPVGSPLHRYVEALADAGITGGCGGSQYCPESSVTRGQMAVFISAALGLHWPK